MMDNDRISAIIVSPGNKKLKQTRLPFHPISETAKPLVESRKRKPSVSSEESRASKIGKTSDVKENVIKEIHTIEILDDSQDSPAVLQNPLIQVDDQEPNESAKIVIKLPGKKKLSNKRKDVDTESNSDSPSTSCKKKSKKSKDKRKSLAMNPGTSEEEEPIALDKMQDDDELEDCVKSVSNSETLVANDMIKESLVKDDDDPKVLDKKQDDDPKVLDKKRDDVAIENCIPSVPGGPNNETLLANDKIKESLLKIDEPKVLDMKQDDVVIENCVPAVLSPNSEVSEAKDKPKSLLKIDEPKVLNKINDKVEGTIGSSISSIPSTSSETDKLKDSNKKDETKEKTERFDSEIKESFENNQEIEYKENNKIKEIDEISVNVEKNNTNESSEKSPKKPPVNKSKVLENDKNSTEIIDLDIDSNSSESEKSLDKSLNQSLMMDDSYADDEMMMLLTPNAKLSNEEKARKLTPKQLARKKEFEMRALQKQKEKDDRRRKLQEEKEARQKEREEQERLKKKDREEKEEQRRREREEKEEQKRREKEEKEEQRKKEKEDREKKKQAEIDQKNEEKRQKEEERKKREEQKEEEKRKKEEEKAALENKKKKEASLFTNFFVKKKTDAKNSDDENSNEQVEVTKFMPFRVKGDMRLAPIIRKTLNKEQKQYLIQCINTPLEDKTHMYLKEIKTSDYKCGSYCKTWQGDEENESSDDVVIIDDDLGQEIEDDPAKKKQKFRCKFLLFSENRRPAYRGTWRKKSTLISARRPFATDQKYFDYEVDSDDEWEEEEPGESLHGSDDEKDVDPEEDYEVDNEFFVPHGHLSDEELQDEDDDMEDNSPETQKAKLKILQQEFAAEMKKKTEKIKPRLIGCIWENNNNEGEEELPCSAVIWDVLKKRAMIFDDEQPVVLDETEKIDIDTNSTSPTRSEQQQNIKKIRITEASVKDLIRLVHGNLNSRKFLVKEFQAYRAKTYEGDESFIEYTIESVSSKIKDIAEWKQCPEEGEMQNKMCWYCSKETLQKFNLDDLTLPNTWSYLLPIEKLKRKKRTKTSVIESPISTAGNKGLLNTLWKEKTIEKQPETQEGQ